MKFEDEQKINEMGLELRRQHQQFIEIFEAKEQQIVFEQQKAMEFSINNSDKESMIRCYDQQTQELQIQIDRLNDQLALMCPLSQLTEAKRQLSEATEKIISVEAEKNELSTLLAQANNANQNNQTKIQMIADKYLAIIKRLKVDLSDFKKIALEQIQSTKTEIKNQMVAQLQSGIDQQIRRDELLQQ